MSRTNQETRREALRLRAEERLSLPEIAKRVGVPRSTCYYWIKDAPLAAEERHDRRAAAARARPKPRKDRGQRSSLHEMAGGRSYTAVEAMAISAAATVLRLAIHKWKVMSSVFDGDTVDFYVTRPDSGRHLKIQVKTARGAGQGLPTVSLRRMHNGRAVRYVRGDFDILVGYWLYSNTAYVWTFGEVEGRTASVTVGPSASEAWAKVEQAFSLAAG